MAEIRPQDILARFGGKALKKFGVLCVPGAGRGRIEELKEAFTRADASPCALFLDRDGNARRASANLPRLHYPPGLVDTDGQPLGGLLMEGTRQNKIENGDYEQDGNGGAGNVGATVARDGTQARFGSWSLKVTTANAENSGCAILKRDGTRMSAVASRLHTESVSVYAPAASVGKTLRVLLQWYDATSAVISTSSVSALVLVAGWQRFSFTASSPANTASVICYVITDSAEGVFDFWVDLAHLEEGAFAAQPIPTNTAAVTRAGDQADIPIPLDMASDWSLYLWFLHEASNVASWPDTEPQLDPFLLSLHPTAAASDADNSGTLVLHRQNAGAQYEWEYQVNRVTAARTFSVTPNPQKLVCRHYASDHHLDIAIDGGAFVAGAAPSTVTIPAAQVLLRLRNPGFWTLFDGMLARGLRTQAEFEAAAA